MVAGVQDTVIALTGVTVTVVLAFMVGSWTEVAVIVTVVLVVTDCAVKTPLTSTVPALDPQETAVSKVPVPDTVAAQALSWPDSTEEGVHAIDTPVMLELPDPPPLQAGIPIRVNNVRVRTRTRKPSPRS